MTKILIIEDEVALRESIVDQLGFHGYDVACAENGEQGVNLARQIIPDVIVCDINMPIMDGYGVLEQVRSDPKTSLIPFLFLTAFNQEEERRKGMVNGADDFLIKPYIKQDLLDALETRLKRSEKYVREAEKDARCQLANDLHDGPTQKVAALAMRINFMRKTLNDDAGVSLGELNKLENLAKDLNKDLRHMLFSLRSQILETKGLTAAIETLLKNIEKETNIRTRFVGNQYGEMLPNPTQEVLYKMIEEALNNAKKHANAHLIRIHFWRSEKMFVCRIRDDGVGFDINKVMRNYAQSGSLGMVALKERAASIRGSVRIFSKSDIGTVITVTIPLM